MTDRILVTSALPYMNGIKHIGNLAGSILPADVYARFQRLRGATCCSSAAPMNTARPPSWPRWRPGCRSPHTAPASTRRRRRSIAGSTSRSTISAARHRRRTMHSPSICSCASRRTASSRNACFNRSGRTPTAASCRTATSSAPVPLRRPAARGDHMRRCGQLLDPVELIAPRSALSGSAALETRETRHLFLLQSKLADQLRALARRQARLGPAGAVAGTRSAGPGAAGSLHHARSGMGRAGAEARLGGQGLLRLVRRTDRLYRADPGMG